ncbi:hypothetical protein J6590_009429 [Homalodisca vitripennis]|nr:hypothetical protein J6590_009429 [Homalodisca vitripennis]
MIQLFCASDSDTALCPIPPRYFMVDLAGDLLAQEGKMVFTLRTEINREKATKLARAETMITWQHRLNNPKGRWAVTRIFYPTQLLTGHGYFCKSGVHKLWSVYKYFAAHRMTFNISLQRFGPDDITDKTTRNLPNCDGGLPRGSDDLDLGNVTAAMTTGSRRDAVAPC